MSKKLLISGISIVAAGLLGVIGGIGFIYSGLYNVAATEQHTSLVYSLVADALRRSVSFYARDIEAPLELAGDRITRGLLAYQTHCVQCHGAPGVPPQDFALGMTPLPMNLHLAVSENSPGEIFWVIKHGLKMTGMPAWDYRLTDEEIWDITSFVVTMPTLAPVEYQRMVAALEGSSGAHDEIDQGGRPAPTAPQAAQPLAGLEGALDLPQSPALLGAVPGMEKLGDAEEGRQAVVQYGCATCHIIPDIVGRDVHVGPPLEGIAERKYIAGILVNTPENMIRWLMNPPAVDPLTAMPDLGVKEEHARDMAAYLYTLRYDDFTIGDR